jgi:Lar family restriction alleviation protein
MNEELKPCPFCGGEKSKDDGATGVYLFYEYPHYRVQCSDCYAITRGSFKKSNAIKVWNTRAKGA